MTANLDSEIERLDAALDRLQAAATNARKGFDDRGARASAERDALRDRHDRLLEETEAALGDLDTLIAEARGS